MASTASAPREPARPILAILAGICLAAGVFAAAQVPLVKKGIFPGRQSLLLASRNLAVTGKPTIENEIGTIVSTGTLAKMDSIERPVSNKLSILAFAQVFERAGAELRHAHLFGGAVMGLAIGVFFWLFYLRLGLRVAILAGLAWATFPTILVYLSPGHAEIPLLFLGVALLAVLGPARPRALHWAIAGAALGVAASAKITFAFYAPVFLLHGLWTRTAWRSLAASSAALLVVAVVYIGPGNVLSGDFAGEYKFAIGKFEEDRFPEFRVYSTAYPDPWTFRKDREAYDEKRRAEDPWNKYYGVTTEQKPFSERLRIHADTILSYFEKCFEIRVFGGPLVMAWIVAGFISLARIDRSFAVCLALSLVVTALAKTFSNDARGEHHIHDIAFVFALPLGLGLSAFATLAARGATSGRRALLALGLTLVVFLAHQAASSRVAFDRLYRGDGQLDRVKRLVDATRARQAPSSASEERLDSGEVVAMTGEPSHAFLLNLYTNADVVFFHEATVKRLLQEGRLAEAFREYQVGWILGYSARTTREALDAVPGLALIADREGAKEASP